MNRRRLAPLYERAVCSDFSSISCASVLYLSVENSRHRSPILPPCARKEFSPSARRPNLLRGAMAMARMQAAATAARAFSSAAASGSPAGGGVSMVQGASRGIGLEFAAAASIGESHGSLNLLVNAAGILSIPNVLQPETTLSKVQKSSLLLAYEVNAVGPILVIKHMWPFLKVGVRSETGRGFSLVANMSARVGSIGDNGLGGWHSYRASKTALNQLTMTVFVELAKKDNIACILLHPGTVDTGQG